MRWAGARYGVASISSYVASHLCPDSQPHTNLLPAPWACPVVSPPSPPPLPCQVTSSAKRKLQPGSTQVHQTPDGSFYDLQQNAAEMLGTHCGWEVPEVGGCVWVGGCVCGECVGALGGAASGLPQGRAVMCIRCTTRTQHCIMAILPPPTSPPPHTQTHWLNFAG